MDSVLSDILTGGTTADIEQDSVNEGTEEEDTVNHDYDLTDTDFSQSEETPSNNESGETDETATNESESAQVQEDRTNRAFAEMRTQNKEYSAKISELDSLAKSLGMKDVDDFIGQVKSAQMQKEATAKGIPVEIAQELQEMRDLKNSIIAEKTQAVEEAKEKEFASNIHSFVEENKLTKGDLDKLSQDLDKDGFSVDSLKSMPKAALNRILKSYVGNSYQNNLARKEKAIKELPINQSSKIDTVALNKELDKFARQLAGKN